MISNDKINEIVGTIVTNYQPDKIILFGSYAAGNPTENSDLDLLIIKDTDENPIEEGVKVKLLLKGKCVPTDILVFTNKEINERKQIKQSFVYNALTYGKTLYEKQN